MQTVRAYIADRHSSGPAGELNIAVFKIEDSILVANGQECNNTVK